MDYNILINEYLEGTLDAESESGLFLALSSSEELRKELRQSIELDKGLSKRVSAFVPSSASTMNIFTQLGIGTAVGAATTAAAFGIKHSLMTFLSTYSQAIITGIIAVALTTGSFLTLYNPPDAQVKSNSVISKNADFNNLNNTGIEQNNNRQFPVVSSFSNDSSSTNVRIDTVIKYVRQYQTVKSESSNEQATIEMKQEIATDDKSTEMIEGPDVLIAQESKLYLNNQIQNNKTSNALSTDVPQTVYSPFTIEVNDRKRLNLSFEVKGNGYWSIPQPDVPQYNTPALANLQLTGLYRFSESFKAGIDFRQESFYQNFTGTNEIGEDFVYKQYPVYYSLTMTGRYSFLNKQMYSAFGQASIGGTATGLVSRLMLGFELSPMSNLSFILGIEGSMLTYSHQNNIFNSPKIGLNYGIAFNF